MAITLSRLRKWLSTKHLFSKFNLEIFCTFVIACSLFWLAQEYDAFEYLAEMSEEHEDWELDEIFTLLMISSFALLFVAIRNVKRLKTEIIKREKAEAGIKKLAFFDSLTGLPNRELCHNRLEHILNHAARTEELAAILFIDLDNFKEVNDTYGHAAGDELLRQVTARLSEQLRSDDTLSRFAGDEFIIVVESVDCFNDISVLAEKVLGSIQAPFKLDDNEVHVGMSVGISVYPHDGTDSETLFKHADIAMYHAKHQGKNTFRFFSGLLNQQAKKKIKIVTQLRKAMERSEFTLHYQPVFDAKTYQLKGAEALLRWHNKTLGNVPPADFIPIAEEIGLIQSIGDWVLLQACSQNKVWQRAGYSPIVMSVNMSTKQLSAENYINSVADKLAQTKLEAKFLELELTETILMKDVDLAIKRLKQLHELGISIALDDFGTGYSSMNYLQKFKISRLKIDRSFIQHIPDNTDDVIMVNAMVGLAKNLNLAVTVEGVETKEQKRFIEETGVDSVQGFIFSHPLPADEFERIFLKGDEPKRDVSLCLTPQV